MADLRVEGRRAAVERWLHGHWYEAIEPPWYLRVLEPVYRSLSRQRRRAADAERLCGGVPRVVVGNIAAGGSGKTPLVIALSRLARERGMRPGVASTGYGRQCGATVEVRADMDPRRCGDEPLLLARNGDAPVVVARRRAEALARLENLGVDLILADDGLQDPALHWDLTLCVVDGERGTGNGRLLPAGPLREPIDRLYAVDGVVSKGDWPSAPEGLAYTVMRLRYLDPRSLEGGRTVEMSELRRRAGTRPVHAVAGIGNPSPFFAMLERQGFKPVEHRFADHHRFCRRDFTGMDAAAAIIMTEKDAVKCRDFRLRNAWYVPVEAVLPAAFEEWFGARLEMLRKTRA